MEHEQQQPMSDERLAEIHHIVDTVNDFYGSRLARELLAEVERLRAREAALVEIVRAVADARGTDSLHDDTIFLRRDGAERVIEQARALLASDSAEQNQGDMKR